MIVKATSIVMRMWMAVMHSSSKAISEEVGLTIPVPTQAPAMEISTVMAMWTGVTRRYSKLTLEEATSVSPVPPVWLEPGALIYDT